MSEMLLKMTTLGITMKYNLNQSKVLFNSTVVEVGCMHIFACIWWDDLEINMTSILMSQFWLHSFTIYEFCPW